MIGGLWAIFAGFPLSCAPPVYAAEPAETPAPTEVEPPAEPPRPIIGVEGGVEGGVVGGVVGGVIGGSRVEPAPGEPRTIYWAEMRATTQVVPSWPLGEPREGEHACKAVFIVDITGVPTSVVASAWGTSRDCPDPFVLSVQEAGMTWRFEPYVHEGLPTAVRFQMMFNFVGTE